MLIPEESKTLHSRLIHLDTNIGLYLGMCVVQHTFILKTNFAYINIIVGNNSFKVYIFYPVGNESAECEGDIFRTYNARDCWVYFVHCCNHFTVLLEGKSKPKVQT